MMRCDGDVTGSLLFPKQGVALASIASQRKAEIKALGRELRYAESSEETWSTKACRLQVPP